MSFLKEVSRVRIGHQRWNYSLSKLMGTETFPRNINGVKKLIYTLYKTTTR